MAPRVEIMPADASDPVAGPRQVALRSLDSIPRRRAVTLAVAAHSLQPGLAVCPWTLRGVLQALDDLKLHVGSVIFLGDPAAAEAVFERGAIGHGAHALTISTRPAGPRQLLRMVESRRPAQVPVSWIGTNLVTLVPMAHRKSLKAWHGPCEGALDCMAELVGYDAPTDPRVRIGGRLVSEVFASSTTIVDAHWWAAADDDGALCSDIATPEHVLGAAVGEPYGHAAVDGWLAGLLNLRTRLRHHGSAGRREDDEVISVGGKRRPWPAVKLELTPGAGTVAKPSLSTGIAGRAVQALWSGVGVAARGPVHRRLPPTLRGAFARHWEAYRAVELDAESA